MKKTRLVLLLSLFLAAGNSAICQVSADPTSHPTVIPPSPEAQAFMRYGEYPVDYSTGVPKIDMPIYEIKSGKLSLPISISYHASGIRVDDIASVVGLGWRLNAGGGLTRTVKGRPDENSQGILTLGSYLTETGINNATSNATNFYKLRYVARGNVDAESDNYYYSAGNSLSGQFVYDHLNNLTSLTYSDDKIIRHNNPSNMVRGYWYEVVSADGTRYIFDTRESTTFDSEAYPSTYWLSKIISADGKDEITFEYETSAYAYNDRLTSQSWTFTISPVEGSSSLFYSTNSSMNYPVYLKKIKFKNGYMSFDYAGDRLDLRRNRLTAISIYSNATTAPLKRYQFVQSYFNSWYAGNMYNYRLKLDALNIYDANGALTSYNTFSYNEDNLLPPYFDPSNVYQQKPAYAVDYWGYYNGKIQNPHLIPNAPGPSADRTPNETFAKACILNKITYPTGGYTSFEYESNITGEQSGFPSISGGLRIHRIISKADDVATPVIKRYEYTNDLLSMDMDAYGRYSYPQQFFSVNSNCAGTIGNSMIYFSNPVVPFQSHNGSPVLYQIVSEYSDGGTENLKTTYSYEGQPDIVYTVNSPRYQDQYFVDRSWQRGQLSGVTNFKQVNGNYQPVKWISNEYGDYRAKSIITGTLVQEVIVTPPSSTCYGDGFTPGSGLGSRYYYFDQKIEVGARKLIKEYTVEKDANGTEIVTTKNFKYESPSHLFPTSISYSDSKGDDRKTLLKYPHDFAGNSVYDSMIRKNIIAPVIEQQKYKNTTFLESVKTNYNFWGASLIEPQTVESKLLNNATETRLRFDSYDNTGNVTSFSNENDVKKVYVYGYNNTYPVAEVIGETYAHVSGVLNDGILQNPSSDQALRDELQKIRQNFPAALVNTYTYKRMVGVTSQTDAANRTTYYEYDAFGRLVLIRDQDGNAIKKICYNYAGQPENCSGVPIFINSGMVIYYTKNNCQPSYAGSEVPYMIAPGKYTSTVSQQNADQQAITEANANGQLKANTIGSCSQIVYVNEQRSGYFMRSNCGTGYTGGGKAYVVLQGKYSSTISQAYVNQLAQNEVDANAQAYADQFGDCIPLPTIVDVKNSNFTSQTFFAQFTNTATNVSYQYALSPSGGGALLGQVPVGTYNISITSGGSDLYEWNVGGAYQAGVHTFSATGVYLDYSGTIEISYY